MFNSMDTDHDDVIAYSEFLAAAMQGRIKVHEDVLRRTFRKFDVDNCGSAGFREAVLERRRLCEPFETTRFYRKMVRKPSESSDFVQGMSHENSMCFTQKHLYTFGFRSLGFASIYIYNHIIIRYYIYIYLGGKITAEDLRGILGEHFEGTDAQDLIREADTNGDGMIEYDEFLAYFHSHDLPAEERRIVTCWIIIQGFFIVFGWVFNGSRWWRSQFFFCFTGFRRGSSGELHGKPRVFILVLEPRGVGAGRGGLARAVDRPLPAEPASGGRRPPLKTPRRAFKSVLKHVKTLSIMFVIMIIILIYNIKSF